MTLKLPRLEEPARYRGLYLFDFGDWTATGYTAEEIAVLLESEQYRDGKVYRIERVAPDGGMELRGVAPERFQFESGMFFQRASRAPAEQDFAALQQAASERPGPCRAILQLAELDGADRPYVTALIYPAEHDADVARWLVDLNFKGGGVVEGGVSHVTDFYQQPKDILRREQLWSESHIAARSREEILGSVRKAVQR